MSPIPIPDQPRVSLLTAKEWMRRWRARGDSRVELALDTATSRSGEGSARAIVEDFTWGAVTWEVNGMRTDTRPGHYVVAAPGVPVEVAHARARDLVAPRFTEFYGTALPVPVPTGVITTAGSGGIASLLALTQVTWGPAIEAAIIGATATGALSVWAARRLRRKQQTRVRWVDAIGFESVAYDFLGIGSRATADPHLDVMLTETLREIVDDVENVTPDVTAARLAKIRASLPAEVVPEAVLTKAEARRAAAQVAVEEAARRREYLDARVDTVAEMVTENG